MEKDIETLTEEIKPQRVVNYDFTKLDLTEFAEIDPLRGPVKVLVPSEEARGYQNQCWTMKVQLATYIEQLEPPKVLKDKRKELYHEKRLHRKG